MSFCDECKREDEDFTTPEERAVLEAAERWFVMQRSNENAPLDEQIDWDERFMVHYPKSSHAGLSLAVALMLKAREPAPATEYNWHCRSCGVVSEQTTAVPKEDRKCPCGAPCTTGARGGT